MMNSVIEDPEWQSADDGVGFDFDEMFPELSDSEDEASEDDVREALVFTELSDYEILDDLTDDLDDSDEPDGSEAEDGEELISPIEADEIVEADNVENESEETIALDEEEEPESLDHLTSNLDDDAFTLLADTSDEDSSDEDSSDCDIPDEEDEPFNLVLGTINNDVVVGGSASDHIQGYGGDDYLDGSDGNDVIHGYSGNDILFGGNGNDELYGSEGSDIIYGGSGADYFECDAGNDIIYGGTGADFYTWRRGDGDDLVIEEGKSRNNVFELYHITKDEVQFKELENGDLQLIIAASSPNHTDGGVITFKAGSMAAFAPISFHDPMADYDYEPDWALNNTDLDSSVCCG